MIVDLVALAQAIDDAPREAGGVIGGMDVLLEHDELVAAEPRHEILGPQHFAQAIGDRAQQLVAAGVTERVVDLLELVEIDEQQRRQLLRALLDRQQAPDLVAEIDPVRKRRQFVVAGQMADPGFRVAPLGNVFDQHDRAAARHRLECPGQRPVPRDVGIGRNHVPRLRVLDFRQDHPAARRRDRTRGDAGRDDVRRAGAALQEIVGQIASFR